MKPWLLIASLLAVAPLAWGCGDDATEPGISGVAELAGDWELRSVFLGSNEQVLADGNAYMYFTRTGEMCSLWRTAYGTYYAGNTGQVLDDGQLLREYLGDTHADWRLALSSSADTLLASAIEPSPSSADGWLLVRAADAPPATCFGAGR